MIAWLATTWNRFGVQLRRVAMFAIVAMIAGFTVEWLGTSNARIATVQPIPIRDIALSPDGELLAVAFHDGAVEVRETGHDRELVWRQHKPGAPILSVHLDTDLEQSTRLVMTRADGKVLIQEARTGVRLDMQTPFPESVLTPKVSIAPSGIVWVLGLHPQDGYWIARYNPEAEQLDLRSGITVGLAPELTGSLLARARLVGAQDDSVNIRGADGLHQTWLMRGGSAELNRSPMSKILEAGHIEGLLTTPDGLTFTTEEGTWSLLSGQMEGFAEPDTSQEFRTASQALVLTDHSDIVWSAAFSPDGTGIVTASDDQTARVWSLSEDGTWQSQVLQGHSGSLYSAAFSPDGTGIVTASDDQTARVWSLSEDGTWQSQVLQGHSDAVWSAAFSPDGTGIVTASGDQTARVWSLSADGTWQSQALQGHSGSVNSAAFSPDGTRIITGSDDDTARVWSLSADGTWQSQTLQGHSDAVWSAAFSPDGTHVVTASFDKTARVWSLSADGAWQSQALQGHSGLLWSAAFSPDGTGIVTASDDQTARVWSLSEDGTWQSQVLQGHSGSLYSAAFSPDGTRIVTASGDQTARVWSLSEDGTWRPERLDLPCGTSSETGLVAKPDAAPLRLWVWSGSNQICALSFDDVNPHVSININDTPEVVTFLPIEEGDFRTRILAGYQDGRVSLVSLHTGRALAEYRGHGAAITQIEVSTMEDGVRAAISAEDGSVQILDLPVSGASQYAQLTTQADKVFAGLKQLRRSTVDMVFPMPNVLPSDGAPIPETVSGESKEIPPWVSIGSFDDFPGWRTADLEPGMNAFVRSCEVIKRRDSQRRLERANWTGTTKHWQDACDALPATLRPNIARLYFEQNFTPIEIQPAESESRFTGYFEPTFQAALSPTAQFSEPVPGLPNDLIVSSGQVLQELPDGKTRPYPPRAEITDAGVKPLAYARPADVFFLQVQGNGRLTLPDGRTLRVVYAGNNGQPFRSVADWLLQRGWITRDEASIEGISEWMDRSPPARVREAMNVNPRFVFFRVEPEGDASLGPPGSMGVPLTPLGSIAVDQDYHALGVPMYVDTIAPGLGGKWSGLLVSQDTGGAIKGNVRGDIYFGTGQNAGAAADTLNAPGRLWVLVPNDAVDHIRSNLLD